MGFLPHPYSGQAKKKQFFTKSMVKTVKFATNDTVIGTTLDGLKRRSGKFMEDKVINDY